MGTQNVAYYYPSFSCDAAQAVTTSVISYRLKKSPLSRASGEKTPIGQPRDRVVTELPLEGSAHLCEVDRSVFGNAVSILARKHPTITSIHLLWNFLKDQKRQKGDIFPTFLPSY